MTSLDLLPTVFPRILLALRLGNPLDFFCGRCCYYELVSSLSVICVIVSAS